MSKYIFQFNDEKVTEYPSMTTVLGDMMSSHHLTRWKVNISCDTIKDLLAPLIGQNLTAEDVMMAVEAGRKAATEKSEEAMTIGTKVHNLIEAHIKKETGNVADLEDNNVSAAFAAFLEWESENIDNWGASEHCVYSNDWKVAGTLDAVAMFHGQQLAIIDFKTSGGFYESYPLQIAGYAKCFEEMHGVVVEKIGCLRLDKETGCPEYKDYTADRERYERVCGLLCAAWWGLKKRRLKYNGDIAEGEYSVANDKS